MSLRCRLSIALLIGIQVVAASAASLLEAMRQPQFWKTSQVSGEWQTVSAQPVLLRQKTPTLMFGAVPKRVFAYGESNGISQIVVVFAERGYSFNLFKKPTEQEKANYRATFDALTNSLPIALAQYTGVEPVQNILRADADEFRFKVRDYTAHGLIYRLRCDTNNRTAITVTILPAHRATTNLFHERALEERQQQLLANVVRQPNGDVLLRNVPVIDQDGRPYCGPAVWTEIARYYGLNVHQELMITGGRDGGKGVKNAAHLKQGFQKEWDFEKVAATIDRGNLVWFGAPGHVALITGYNRQRQEIFRTDSWGEAARNKRVPVAKFVKESGPYMFFEPK